MFFKEFVSVKRKKIKKGASQTYDTPSCFGRKSVALLRAKALKIKAIHKAFALTGRLADCYYTPGAALG